MSLSNIYDWITSESIWLTPGIGWKDLRPRPNNGTSTGPFVNYPNPYDLVYPIGIAVLILIIRFITDRLIIKPIGKLLGIKSKIHLKPKPIPELENAYQQAIKLKKNKGKDLILSHLEIQTLLLKEEFVLKSFNITTERQIERWLRKRTNLDRITTLNKFSESTWRFLCYGTSFLYGLYALWDKSWLLNISECWKGYPHHNLTPDIWWYYIMCSSMYWSLLMSQMFDIARKDFWEMFIHHLATLFLLSSSWTLNFFRIGTVIILLHDTADVILELTKVSKYAGYEKACEILFSLLTITWVFTRLVIFPFYIINSTIRQGSVFSTAMFYIFNSMLILLLILHIFWTYFLFRIIYKTLATGKLDKDERSSSDLTMSASSSSDSESESIENVVRKKFN